MSSLFQGVVAVILMNVGGLLSCGPHKGIAFMLTLVGSGIVGWIAAEADINRGR